MSQGVLVRYGVVSEVARLMHELHEPIERGARVVVQSARGLELATLLEPILPRVPDGPSENGSARDAETREISRSQILRRATPEDESRQVELRRDGEREFAAWRARIEKWNLRLELIDLEWTLDRTKLILYVLNERGPECTKLALAAAAAGLGIVEVQPVAAEGLVRIEAAAGGGGCGSGGCGCTVH